MSTTFTAYGTFSIITCCNEKCGVQFALPQEFVNRLRECHNWFYCPNGHHQYFPQKSDVELERDKAAKLAHRLEYMEADLVDARKYGQHQEDRARAFKGHIKRIKKRVANGVCPCCKRHFENLHRHMAHQHPKYATKEAAYQ